MRDETEKAIHRAAGLLRADDPSAELSISWVREVFPYDDGGNAMRYSPAVRSTIVIDGTSEALSPYWDAIAAIRAEAKTPEPKEGSV